MAVDAEMPTQECVVKVLKLQQDKDYKKDDLCPTVKYTTEEKALLLNKKKTTSKKEPKTPKPSKKDKNGKFQMKITGFFSPPKPKDDDSRSRHSSTETPDSGFSSRAETPANGSDEGSPKKDTEVDTEAEDDTADGQDEIEAEKKKFLDDLDEESESDKESSEESEESEDDFDPNDSDDGGKKKGFNAKKPVKRKQPVKKAALAKKNAGKTILPGAIKSEMSEYEKIRDGNIKEREAMLKALMADFADFKKDSGIGVAKTAPAKKRKREKLNEDGDEVGFSVRVEGTRKSARISAQPEDKDKLGSEITYKDPERRGLAEEQSDYDEEDYQAYEDRVKKRAPRPGQIDPNENVLMPEDVTQAMINKICERFGDKTYNQTIGTTCHQCRQKTTDTKTICRSGRCVGVRGQFCGRCLEIRYGEDCKEALLNPTWSCPPCRGFCNCSICRNRNGKGATGILIQLAQSKGYENVAAYLKALQTKKGCDEYDETDEEEADEEEEKPKKTKKKKGKKGKKAKKAESAEDKAEDDDKENIAEDENKENVEA